MTPFTSWNRCSAVGGACLIALASNGSAAQGATASVSGTVRADDGSGLSDVRIAAARRAARTDSVGRYRLDSLDAGRVRIVVLRMGFSRADSSTTLRAGERIE